MCASKRCLTVSICISIYLHNDDTQLYLRLKPSQQHIDIGITKLEACLKSVSQWMNNNFFKLNENKTKYMLIGSNRNLSKFSSDKIIVGNSEVRRVSQVRNIGVVFNSGMLMKSQISKVVSTASSHIHNIWRIRKYLTQQATEQIVHSFVTCRLDMCNSLYSAYQNKGNPYSKAHCSKVNRFENLHVAYK